MLTHAKAVELVRVFPIDVEVDLMMWYGQVHKPGTYISLKDRISHLGYESVKNTRDHGGKLIHGIRVAMHLVVLAIFILVLPILRRCYGNCTRETFI